VRPRWGLAAVAALLVAAAAPSLAYPDPDKAYTFPSECSGVRHFVYDFVGLLSEPQGEVVEQDGCALYREDGAHLVLAIVPDLGGEAIDSYALHLVRDWGIGDKDRLDGILVLYAMDDGTGSGQGAVRVEVGYGLEGVVNSLMSREAVESMESIQAQDLANGSTEAEATSHALAAGAAGLALFTQQNYEGSSQGVPSGGGGGGFSIPWWGWLLIAAAVLTVLGAGGRRGGSGFLTGLLLGGLLRRGGGGGGQGRGGGGFGGGKSGGGGWNGKL
jgi:uncharacterized protein